MAQDLTFFRKDLKPGRLIPMECPRCHRVSKVPEALSGEMQCGECLIEAVEFITLIPLPFEPDPPKKVVIIDNGA